MYRGGVTAVGPDWLELGAGWQGSVTTDRAGRPIVRENGDTNRPKRISTVGTIPGGDPNGVGQAYTHWLPDLKVGDIVFVRTHEGRNGDEWTTEVRIARRPGGKIPPLRISEPDPTWHPSNQAEQDWEEKGTPIPSKYLDKNGRAPWTNPPYPPVAPLPRAVALKP